MDRGLSDTDELDRLLASTEALAERSMQVLGWAHEERTRPPRVVAPPAPDPPAPIIDPPAHKRPTQAQRTVTPAPLADVVELPRESELAPVVADFLAGRGLAVARELCVYPGRSSRRRTVADLVALRVDRSAVTERMRVERRRVTIAEFWPALLETLRLAPDRPFRRRDLLERLSDSPLTRSIPPGRLTRYLRTLRRYGYLRRVSAVTYRKRCEYVGVAAPRSAVAVELKRKSFRAALAQARSYARVVDTVYVATAGTWRAGADLEQEYRALGIGALEVAGSRVREVLAPEPGKSRDPRCEPYLRILEERLVREAVLDRPRAFG